MSNPNVIPTSPIKDVTPTATAPGSSLTSGQISLTTATPRPYGQNQGPSIIGGTTSLDVTVVVNSALSNIDGLTGNLLSTVVAQVNSVIALVNKVPGALPSDSVANLGSGFDKDKLPGVGSVFGKDMKAVNGNEGAGNFANEDTTVADTPPNVPAVTFEVKPLPVEQSAVDNEAALTNLLNGAGTRRRKFAGERRET